MLKISRVFIIEIKNITKIDAKNKYKQILQFINKSKPE